MAETKIEAPSGFPATFLYTMSWEDPRPDMEVSASSLTQSVAYFKGKGPYHLGIQPLRAALPATQGTMRT